MAELIRILTTETDGDDGLIVTFSDETTGAYVVEELLALRPVRERSRTKCIKTIRLLNGELKASGARVMKSAIQRRDPNRFLRILEARRAQVGQKRLHVEAVPLEAIPKLVSKNTALARPRRPKGVPKGPRAD